MDKERMKGKAENVKGRIKQAAGSLTGNKELEAQGLAERAKGAAREKLGEAKEAVEEEETQEEKDAERRDD